VWELYREQTGLAFDLTWIASREESMVADHLAAVGQQPALERIAYIFLYIFNRARRAGMLQGRKLHVPITQEHIADTMGLSIVHTNKSIRTLRDRKLVDWSRSTLTLVDEEKLTELAGFTTSDTRPRPFI
jgi:CRP-like cAMP-binding protein